LRVDLAELLLQFGNQIGYAPPGDVIRYRVSGKSATLHDLRFEFNALAFSTHGTHLHRE
jgi:hypothetical protein